jgi:phosphonate transport system permease protein
MPRIERAGSNGTTVRRALPDAGYRPMLAPLFYRWEVNMRETSILGFHVDSGFAELQFDRALFLILITALLNIGVDAISRTLRSRLRLQTALEQR